VDSGFSFLGGGGSSNPMSLVNALNDQSSVAKSGGEIDTGRPYQYDPTGLVNILMGGQGAPGKTAGQRVAGAAGGALSGAAAGATAGSVIPGIGTAIGAIVGALVGGVGGGLS
jgi:hypothetical protein